MKFYAIRQINGETVNEILTDWNKCKEKVMGNRAEYKSFKTEVEAKNYLGSHKEEDKEEDILKSENYIYYVDGSYLNDRIGWGFVLVKNDEVISKMCGWISPDENTSRNITGELMSSMMAVRHAISNDIKEIYLVNDYQGISSYVTGAWSPKKVESIEYTKWMKSVEDRIKINFIKVKGHTNNKYNDLVDELAKLGTTL